MEGLISAYEHDLAGNVLPKPCSLFDEQNHETFSEIFPKLPIKHLSTAFRYPNYMVLAFPP
jgi:hypothetical protein